MESMRNVLIDGYVQALRAVDPRGAVAGVVRLDGSTLTVGSHTFSGVDRTDVVVVALGKAAAGMAQGAFDAIGTTRGLVVAPSAADTLFATCIGSHPIPDAKSLMCGTALLATVEDTKPSDVVVFLVSGGGSALAVLPADGVSLFDIIDTNRRLVSSGMPIEDMNAERAAMSRIKGGRLAAATTAERQVTLVLSDVVGAGPENVASGPTFGLGLQPTDVLFDVVGSPAIAAQAAAEALSSRGYQASVACDAMRGGTRTEARRMVAATHRGTISIAAGETTIEVTGDGLGGRNQDAALAVAVDIDGIDVTFAALGTDGIDGPTEAAGAVVDGGTATKARDRGIDIRRALEDNDSHTALSAIEATVVTGPSGTNVADLWMVARGPF
jgi:hydroxypyruvate reductase